MSRGRKGWIRLLPGDCDLSFLLRDRTSDQGELVMAKKAETKKVADNVKKGPKEAVKEAKKAETKGKKGK